MIELVNSYDQESVATGKKPLFRPVFYFGKPETVLLIDIIAVTHFRYIGSPAITSAEMAATVEAIFLFIWLNMSLPEKMSAGGSLVRKLIPSVIGTVVTYKLALKLTGGAVVTAMIGSTIGEQISLGIVWKNVHQLFNL